MKRLILSFALSLYFLAFAVAQDATAPAVNRCGTDKLMQYAQTHFPHVKAEHEKVQQMYAAMKEHGFDTKSGEILTIPVVVHVVWSASVPESNISDEQIYSQIDVLNQVYRRNFPDTVETREIFKDVAADPEIEFCLASVDPDGNPTLGITRTQTDIEQFLICDPDDDVFYPQDCELMKFDNRGGKDGWDTRKYLNIWVVNDIDKGVLGYAYLPGNAINRAVDGFVVVHRAFGTLGTAVFPYNGGMSSVHEIGHWLGLNHPWGPSNADDPNGSCELDDGLADTPHTRRENYACSMTRNSCYSSQDDDLPDMVENYMDYSPDACQNIFTNEQTARMRRNLTGNGYRASVVENVQACTNERPSFGPTLSNIISPPDEPGNCSIIDPVIEVTNFGTAPLNTLKLTYGLTGSDQVWTYDWESEIGIEPLKREEIALPRLYVTADAKQVKTATNGAVYELVTTFTNPTTEEVSDTFYNEFPIQKTGFKKVVYEDFEGPLFPPLFWVQNEREKFEKNEGASHGDGNASLYINNYEYDGLGNEDMITLREMDLSSSENTIFTFEYAYAQRDEAAAADSLLILITADCETTWDTLFHRVGSELATTDPVPDEAFIPSEADWQEVSIDLSPYSYGRNTLIRFIQKRGAGNNLYLDNIFFHPSFVVGQASPTPFSSNIAVYPNPTSTQTNISFDATIKQSTTLKVYDTTGRVVYQQAINTQVGHNSYLIATSDFPIGMYFIQVGADQLQQKLLIVR